jgi:hypothetical protein
VSAVNFVTTAPHEFGANLVFEDMELRPYFAMRSCVQELNGGESDIGTFRHNSHSYTVSVGYQDSGLAPRPEDEIQDVKEYRLSVKDKEAPERKADFLIQSRWHNMKTTGCVWVRPYTYDARDGGRRRTRLLHQPTVERGR